MPLSFTAGYRSLLAGILAREQLITRAIFHLWAVLLGGASAAVWMLTQMMFSGIVLAHFNGTGTLPISVLLGMAVPRFC